MSCLYPFVMSLWSDRTSGVPLQTDPMVQRAHTPHNKPTRARAAHTGVKRPFKDVILKRVARLTRITKKKLHNLPCKIRVRRRQKGSEVSSEPNNKKMDDASKSALYLHNLFLFFLVKDYTQNAPYNLRSRSKGWVKRQRRGDYDDVNLTTNATKIQIG